MPTKNVALIVEWMLLLEIPGSVFDLTRKDYVVHLVQHVHCIVSQKFNNQDWWLQKTWNELNKLKVFQNYSTSEKWKNCFSPQWPHLCHPMIFWRKNLFGKEKRESCNFCRCLWQLPGIRGDSVEQLNFSISPPFLTQVESCQFELLPEMLHSTFLWYGFFWAVQLKLTQTPLKNT